MNNFSLHYLKKYILIIITILAINCGTEPGSFFERYSENTGNPEQDFINYTVNKISDILEGIPRAIGSKELKDSAICAKAGVENPPLRVRTLVYDKQTPWILNEAFNQNAKELAALAYTGLKNRIPTSFVPKPVNKKTGAWISKEMEINDNEMIKFLCDKLGGNGKIFSPYNTGKADFKGGENDTLVGALTSVKTGPDVQVGIGRYKLPGDSNKYLVAIYFHGTNTRNQKNFEKARQYYLVLRATGMI